jgi:hypothetical protein
MARRAQNWTALLADWASWVERDERVEEGRVERMGRQVAQG